jgi:hypothetical protein
MLIMLITFLVPGPIYGIFGGKGGDRNPVFASWERPGHGTVEWRMSDIQGQERVLSEALRSDPYLSMQVGILGQPKPADYVRLLVMEQLAQDSGIRITDADLAEHLLATLEFQRISVEDYKNGLRATGRNPAAIESIMKRVLAAARFQQLVAFAGAVPDPAKIEEQWHQQHAEFSFDYVQLPVETRKEEARQALPDDAGLKTWFDALGEAEKDEFRTGEKRKAELVLFRGADVQPATELLAAYPETTAEGTAPTTPEDLAQQYHNRVFHRRFVKPKAADAAADAPPEFFSLEEVKDKAMAEAPIYFAMQRWLDALKTRKAGGETIDLAAEAAKVGLEHRAIPDALTREELEALPELGDRELADAVFSAAADGSFYWSLVLMQQGIAVVRTTERTEPVLPEFETIRDRVAEKWVEPKARELALQRLRDLRDGLETFEPPVEEGVEPPPADGKVHKRAATEAFAAAAQGAGLEAKNRPWLDRAAPVTKDPLYETDEAHKFFFTQSNAARFYDLVADEVAEPVLSRDQKAAYLVRQAGKREVPLTQMTPTDYERLKSSARNRAVGEVIQAMDVAYLEKNFGLKLLRGEEPEAEAGKGESKDAGETKQ